jgi:hypothetical protein
MRAAASGQVRATRQEFPNVSATARHALLMAPGAHSLGRTDAGTERIHRLLLITDQAHVAPRANEATMLWPMLHKIIPPVAQLSKVSRSNNGAARHRCHTIGLALSAALILRKPCLGRGKMGTAYADSNTGSVDDGSQADERPVVIGVKASAAALRLRACGGYTRHLFAPGARAKTAWKGSTHFKN